MSGCGRETAPVDSGSGKGTTIGGSGRETAPVDGGGGEDATVGD